VDDSLHKVVETLEAGRPNQREQTARPRFSSLGNWILETVRRSLLNFCDAYFWLHGFREVQLPSITIVIPVADQTEKLAETIKSLLAARYNELYVSVVWLEPRRASIQGELEHPNIQFYGANPGATKVEAIRQILVQTGTPVFAWLEPGDTITPDVLQQIGKLFLRSPRLGGVLVPKQQLFAPQAAPQLVNFSFLWAQNSSLPVKLFVRREYEWAAGKTFAGTDYDCDDWAVALNTSRFSRVKTISNGFWFPGRSSSHTASTESDQVRSKISAVMWCTERLRRSALQRFVEVSTLPSESKPEFHGKSARSSSADHSDRSKEWMDGLVPSALSESLVGFYAGEESEFQGAYRWYFANRESIIRRIFYYPKAEISIFEFLSKSDHQQTRARILDVHVDPEHERRAKMQAKGAANLLAALPQALRVKVGNNGRAAIFQSPTQLAPFTHSGGVCQQSHPSRSTHTTPDSTKSQQEGFDVIKSEQLFDILVLQQSLNTLQKPWVVLRNAANHLKWGGWLVIGCTAFVAAPPLSVGWQVSPSVLSADCQMIFSQRALVDLVQLAGFRTNRLIGLSEGQLEYFALSPPETSDWIGAVVPTFFQSSENRSTKESYVLLVCQRTL
jgi:hypothetical protein